MPLFDYECPTCHRVQEVLVWRSTDTAPTCTNDHEPAVMEKLVSALGFRIKGFASFNGYSRTNETIPMSVHKQPGMRVQVKDGGRER